MKELNECTIDELKELARMGQKFEIMRTAYNQTSDRLMSISQELTEMAKGINPLIQTKTRSDVRIPRKEIVNELYELMSKGTQITKELVEKAYPNMNQDAIGNTMYALSKMPNVVKAKDGQKVRLFLRNA